MEEIVLKAEKRDEMTKGTLKNKRKQGRIPAIIYGENQPSLALFVDEKKLQKSLHTSLGENVIINLEIEKEKPKTVMIKEIQRNPLNDSFLHVDFQQISLTKKIELAVPLHLTGEAAGIKEGGMLEQHLWELKIRCLPTKIPQSITVDVSGLELNKSITVKDLVVPQDVDIMQNPEQAVASVSIPPAVPEEVPVAAPTVAEPEVIGKGKKEKEEEIAAGEEKEEKKVKEVKTKEVKEEKK